MLLFPTAEVKFWSTEERFSPYPVSDQGGVFSVLSWSPSASFTHRVLVLLAGGWGSVVFRDTSICGRVSHP